MPDPKDSLWQRILDRHSFLKKIREPVEKSPVASWSDIIDLLQPGITPWTTTGQEGQDIGLNAQTSYPQWALRICASGMMSQIVSRADPWFAYAPHNRLLREVERFKEYYQECREEVDFTLKNSNFHEILPGLARVTLAIGNGVLQSEEDFERESQTFIVPHPRECFWSYGRNNQIKMFHREFEYTAFQAQEEYEKANLSNTLQRSLERKRNIFTKFTFIHAIYHRDDIIFKNLPDKDFYLPNRPWIGIHIQYKTDNDKKKPLRIPLKGYWVFPIGVWRWEYNSDETYGRGIGTHAIYDIKQLNQMEQTMVLAAQKSVAQPMVYPSSLRGKVHSQPDGETYVDVNQEREAVRPLYPHGINYPIGIDREDRMKQKIDNWFAVRQFLMLQDKEKALSPLELYEMLGEKFTLMAGGVAQFESGCLDSSMERVFWSEFDANRLPPMPEELMGYGESPMPKVEYIGPLNKALRRLFTTRNLQQLIATATPIIGFAPESRYVLKAEEMLRKLLEDEDVDRDIIRTREEYTQMVTEMAQRQQQMENLQMLGQLIKTIPSLQRETSETSPMAALAGRPR